VTDAPTEREGEGAWTRLRRRKVVQWALAYAAGAWALLQGLEYISNTFHWPEQFQQISTLALLIGLPIVVVIAWYHGDRGEQRVSGAELTIIVLLLLLAGGFLWHYQQPGEKSAAPGSVAGPVPAATTPAAAPAVADTRPSIAVLPFENRSDKHEDAFFVDGIHDDILTQLSKVSALKVISRTSVERFRDTKLPLQDVAKQLGVKSILEGGVQRAGDRVRINVQLIDTGTDAHLWAESYDRELTAANIFAIQSELAAAIAGALKASLTTAERKSVNAIPTENLKAWEAYQRGRQQMEKRTTAGLAEAQQHFQAAIDLDPRFALAHAGLAVTHIFQAFYSGAPRDASLARAEKAVSTALEIEPNLGEAWATSALIATEREQYDRAEPMYRRAIELNPNYASAHHWFSYMLAGQGRYADALSPAERALELDPFSGTINNVVGTCLASLGRFDEAMVYFRRVIEIDPSMPAPYWMIGIVDAYGRNRFADAILFWVRATELDPGNPMYAATLARGYLDLGDDVQARRVIESAQAQWPANALVNSDSAFMHINRGEHEAARQHAQRCLETDPRGCYALVILRNGDLDKGDYKAARARYENAYAELLGAEPPLVDGSNYSAAVDLALVLQKTGEIERARALLDRGEQVIRTIPRLGGTGYGPTDVQIYALRGEKTKALAALREAERAGWRDGSRYYRDFDPNLASIRNEPEFKAVFADIERDMARQRAELAKRPKDAPLDLGVGE